MTNTKPKLCQELGTCLKFSLRRLFLVSFRQLGLSSSLVASTLSVSSKPYPILTLMGRFMVDNPSFGLFKSLVKFLFDMITSRRRHARPDYSNMSRTCTGRRFGGARVSPYRVRTYNGGSMLHEHTLFRMTCGGYVPCDSIEHLEGCENSLFPLLAFWGNKIKLPNKKVKKLEINQIERTSSS